MNNMKYTTDGRKVVVIGKLNAQETIVQEIFVTAGGGEIPSGEQFVTKSLHDEPVKSWKEKDIERIDLRHKECEREMEALTQKVRGHRQDAQNLMKALRVFATKATEESFTLLDDFVAGRITHFVIDRQYGSAHIDTFERVMNGTDDWHARDLKLLSLMGKADGTLQWNVHRYSDGSGCGTVGVYPARSLDHARDILRGLFDDEVREWRENDDKRCPPDPASFRDLGQKVSAVLDVPADVAEWYAAKAAENKADKIAKLEAELAKAKSE